jgi:uncharacterized repeat protein (TIGR03803 family)
MKNNLSTAFHTATMTLTEFSSANRRHRATAICLFLCLLGLVCSASAQEAGRAMNTTELKLHKLLKPPRTVSPVSGDYAVRAEEAAPATNAHDVVLHHFASPLHGAYPATGVIRDLEGNLYGTTNGSYSDIGGGGTHDAGVVFKIDRWGNQTVLYSFTGGADGSSPNGLVRDADGNLYGTATYGGNNTGAAGAGVVFKVDTSGHETVLYTFTGGNDGAGPNGVLRDWKGDLYGTTYAGGAPGAGVVFKVDPSGKETVLYTFTGGNDGGYSASGVTLDKDGNVYGTTNNGGEANLGVAFKVDKSGHETVLHTFKRGAEGNQPDLAGVILDEDYNLYGTTSFNAAGGGGAVYKLDRSGSASVVYAFPGNAGGQYPYNAGVTLGSDGRLYGTTDYGGRHGAGVLYQLDKSGCESVLYTFDFFTAKGYGQPTGNVIRDSAGNFYGTTFIGQADVNYGSGVVYKVDAAGHATVLHNFTGGADGGNPYGGVLLGAKGNIYGTASGGGASGAGVVFKIDTSGKETVLYSFTGGTDGGYPFGSILSDSAGNLYGTTNGGGASGAGVVFKVDLSGNETVLYSFTGGADGGYPLAGLIRDAAGNLYGTTNGGGAAGAGVVFKVDTSGNETVLYGFTGGDDGAYPLWVVLARDWDGNLYGTTSSGGTTNAGVVFKIDTSGNETVLHSFTGGADGGSPYAGAVLGPEGQLYGATAFGGQANVGVVFEIKP